MYKSTLSFLIAAGLIAPALASACGFHNYAPQPTLVDRLAGSEEIVLARSAPDNPFRFQAIEALEGSLASPDLPFLVDSVTLRRFALNADSAVLFARDGSYGPWQRLAYVDAALDPVLRTILERLPSWEYGEVMDRFHYFATLVGHPDDRIHKLALRELDQADYSILRNLDLTIKPDRLQEGLNQPNETEFTIMRVLLLGLSEDIKLRDRLEKGVQENVASEGDYLGAYATALIELVGPDAVAELAANYLTNQNLSLLTRELLIEAIAMHSGSENPDLKSSTLKAINSALWVDPRLAGAAARQFGARGNWSLKNALQAVLDEGAVVDMADKQDVAQYIEFALEET